MALGVTYQRPEDDRHSYSEQYLHTRMVGAMGGRAAEELIFDSHTTGAENDMQQATELARQMVTRSGMSARLGPVTLAPREGSSAEGLENFGFGGKPYGAATADVIDQEVQRLLEEAASEASRLLLANRRELDGLAAALLEHETLDEPAIRRATGCWSSRELHQCQCVQL
jgi:cell division protease FtsH